MYGAKPENVYEIKWWIQVNCDGSHIKDDRPNAEVYQLIVEYTNKPYQQQRFRRYGLVLQKGDDGEMFILDRGKSKK